MIALGRFKELIEFRAAPEAGLELLDLSRGAGDCEVFLEDDRPAGERKEDKNGQNALHHEAGGGDKGQNRQIGSGLHVR